MDDSDLISLFPQSPVNAASPILVDQTSISANFSTDQADTFWPDTTIYPSVWNRYFPYALLVLERSLDPSGTVTYAPSDFGQFVLPFAPESLSISIPFAVTTTPTLGGIIEEHNGAPFRIISMNGTMGVLPTRPALNSSGTSASQADQNDVASASNDNLALAAGTVLSSLDLYSGSMSNPTPLGASSGYYQMEGLKKFFENYHNLKKNSYGAKYQLALGLFKQNAIYCVTAMNFTANQNANSPLEYTYSLQLKAWKRVQLNAFPLPYIYTPVVKQTSQLQDLLNKVQGAQDTLQMYRSAIGSISGQVQTTVFEPLRQIVFFAKDILGVGLTLSDTSVQVAQESQNAVLLAVSVPNSAISLPAEIQAPLINLATKLGYPASGTGLTPSTSTYAADPGNDPFNNPQNYYATFSKISVSGLNLPPVTMRRILTEREQIRQLTRLDFENMRNTIVNVQADYADACGAGSEIYNKTFGRSNVISTKTPSETDFNILFALNTLSLQLNALSATYQTNLTNSNSINFVAGAASRSGIAFNIPQSKFQVPFQYGFTLEQLATQYLGSSDRWMEIAALNGLQAPYVDEEGFDLPLLTNGQGNTVTIADASNLYIGQSVWLSSSSTIRTQRNISKITKISTSYVIVTLTGDADLARFSYLSEATLHAFLPNTVNSMMAIYIPSQDLVDTADYQTKAIPGVSDYDTFLQAGGVDLLLTQTNDLAITPDGDCKLAIGLTNIVQQARVALSVPIGSLNRHPGFGVPKIFGQSTADVNVNQVASSLGKLFSGNPTISSVSGVIVTKVGPTVTASMNLNVKGINQSIPVKFKLS